MSDTDRLMQWIKEGEHERLDFKRTVKKPEKIARNLVAFANKKGGIILIGISDYGEILGIDPEQEKYILCEAANRFCIPKIPLRFRVYRSQGLRVLAVEVEAKKSVEHRAIDQSGQMRYWIRQDDECVSDEKRLAEISELESKDDPIAIFSEREEGLIQFLKKYHSITVPQFMKLSELPFDRAKKSLDRLFHVGVLERHGPKGKRNYTLKN